MPVGKKDSQLDILSTMLKKWSSLSMGGT